MDPVVHFEMPYEDQDRVAAFYRAAFGWNMQGTSEEMGNYVQATTTHTGPQGRPKAPGAINGGFFPKKPDWPAQHPSVVIGVGDIKDAIERISRAGGTVLGEPMMIPGIGQYVSFTDTEGNRVSLLEPAPMEKPARAKSAAKKKAAPKRKTAAKKKRKR
jgi:predicted enzyme related to lactoylglutathione lyase